jgi:RNA polymerase sigma-70 factor, ECF subfamily
MLDDPAEADEATQDVFIKAIHQLHAYRGDSSFVTWLYAIGLNVCRGRLRQRRRRERTAQVWQALRFAEKSTEPRTEQIAIAQETNRAVWQALQRLNDKQREVVILRYYHDLKLDDIVQIVGVSERTVRTWLHQAHDQLREWLKEDV